MTPSKISLRTASELSCSSIEASSGMRPLPPLSGEGFVLGGRWTGCCLGTPSDGEDEGTADMCGVLWVEGGEAAAIARREGGDATEGEGEEPLTDLFPRSAG